MRYGTSLAVRRKVRREKTLQYENENLRVITAIEIDNFRGFGKPLRIELAPVTLLFGANSSGKTAIFHALLFLYEVLVSRKESPETSVLGGRFVNFGSFSDLVFAGDQNRKIRIKVEMSFDWEGNDWSYGYDTGDYGQPKQYISKVAAEVVFCNINNRPCICEYVFWAGDSPVVKVDFGDNLKDRKGSYYYGLIEALVTSYGNNSVCPVDSEWDVNTFEKGFDETIADGHSFLIFTSDDKSGLDDEQAAFFSGWVKGISHQLIHHLTEMVALGPLREVPMDFVARYQKDLSRVSTGLSAWDDLVHLSPEQLKPFNKWLGGSGLDLGYQLKQVGFAPLEIEQYASDGSLSLSVAWERIQDQNTRLVHRRIKSEMFLVPASPECEKTPDVWLRPCAVGVGVSQIIPVIYHSIQSLDCKLLAKRLLMIEQPELHLHPRAQTRLGDMFIEGFVGSSGSIKEDLEGRFISNKQVIIETHSEHLILRMLRRIRETTHGSLPSTDFQLYPEQLSVHYMQRSNEGINATHLRIDEEGEFIDRWPEGFFDDRAEELF